MKLKFIRQSKTFKEKIFRSFMLAIAIPVILLSLFVFAQTRTMARQTQEEALSDVLLQTERNITTHIDGFRHSLFIVYTFCLSTMEEIFLLDILCHQCEKLLLKTVSNLESIG